MNQEFKIPEPEVKLPGSASSQTRHWIIGSILGIAILACSSVAYLEIKSLKKAPKQRDTQEMLSRVRVREVRPQSITLDLEGYGTVRPKHRVSLAPQVAGRIIMVDENLETGRFVKKGTVLVRIDPTDYEAAVQTHEALIAQAKAEITILQQTQTNLGSELIVQKERVALALDERQRMETTYRSNAISKTEKDRATAAHLRERSALILNENALALIPAREAQAKAVLEQRLAGLKKAGEDLARTSIVAPFDACVVARNVELGQYVATFPLTGIATLADYSAFEIPVMIEPEQLENLPGLPLAEGPTGRETSEKPHAVPKATARWLAFDGKYSWPGEVIRTEPMDETTRTISGTDPPG